MHQNVPNPFGNETRLDVELPTSSYLYFDIYDASGKLVRSFSGNYLIGKNSILIDMANYPSGVYKLRVRSEFGEVSKSMIKVH